MLDAYAKTLSQIAKGEEPTIEIDDKVMDNVLKYIDKMSKLDEFDIKVNGVQATPEDGAIINPMEQRSKIIKQKINVSSTHPATKV